MQAPPEKYAFVATLNPPGSKLNDALLVVDVDPESRTYGHTRPFLSGIGGCAGRASPRFARAGIRKFQRAFVPHSVVSYSTHWGIL